MPVHYNHISLNDEETEKLVATATRLIGPLGLKITPVVAVRILTNICQGFSTEQARKYTEAVEEWKKQS
jgi:hypothetical protein